ncbi:SoxR reducing system RseC family protein [Pseudomonas schmalbachii]|uniref:SoxR reducing system RseC family protein n=1 Tax=Pseudomonas schmalbachii TaxID=2816993 RepID=A0ABS3TS35_9PSED|nr:SoxR reducing system RseC family protein [Pseudomonas schmalbachii]MBO3276491.1 SoxR reducing system RseC family protein [Pseudomonas schmalbachii]
MIEERGRVVALEKGAVWVETVRQSTCSGCSMNAGCGQGLLGMLGIGARRGRVRALTGLQLSVGDSVVFGIREDLLLKSALQFYLLPLLGLFAAALLTSQCGLSEPLVVLAGIAGFLASWSFVRRHSRRHSDDPALQPVVLRALIAET